MQKERIITNFVESHAPDLKPGANGMARHDLQSLSRFLNIDPEEVIALAEAGLLQASEVYPGAPSLSFSTYHLSQLRREICLQHVTDAIELCGEKSGGETLRIVEMSWRKRSDKVIELAAKH